MDNWNIENPSNEVPQLILSNDDVDLFGSIRSDDLIPMLPYNLEVINGDQCWQEFVVDQSSTSCVDLNTAPYVDVPEFSVFSRLSSNEHFSNVQYQFQDASSSMLVQQTESLSPTSTTVEPISSTTDSNSSSNLAITMEPQKIFRFRYQSEIGDPHGFLGGDNRANKCVPTMELRFANNVNGQYFIRFTLVELEGNGEQKRYVMSSHKLQRLDNKLLECESTLYPFEKISPKLYRFTMNNYKIINTTEKDCQKEIQMKFGRLQERQDRIFVYSKYIPEPPKKNTQKKSKTPKAVKVYISCEAFQYIDNRYISIAGPIFTQSITHGEPLKIVRNCNINGYLDKDTEVTILVSGVKSLDFQIRIAEKFGANQVDKPWETFIAVIKKMVHSKTAITFQMPRYGGDRKGNKIECTIRLERLNGERSNTVDFNYISKLKRPIDLLSDDAETHNESTMLKKRHMSENSNITIIPDSIDQGKFDQKENIPPVIINKHLRKVFEDLREFYKTSMDKNKKAECSELVKRKLDDFQLKHPHGNSILHDILESKNLEMNEKFYKMMNHFELRDWARDSTNAFGDTALMFACLYRNCYWIRPLIKLQTPIEARDAEDGCNVLHIAFEKSHESCIKIIMQCMKNGMNAPSFLAALKDHNFSGLTPLHVAVINDDIQNVGDILQFCRKHNEMDAYECREMSTGNTILHLAASKGSRAMYECILKHTDGRLVNILNYAGRTPDELLQILDNNRRRSSLDVPIENLAIKH